MTNKLRVTSYELRVTILLVAIYLLGIISLFLYSFTQVDLNLTMTKVSFWFAIQDFFQHIGYYQRPLSTVLYLTVLLVLFVLYYVLFKRAGQRAVTGRIVWFLVGTTAGILFLSYPAFSYDIYNYMFDARIVTLYHQNPYEHRALDYPADNWLLFMRWTHRVYPYGPLWLGLTIPLSFLGIQKFLLTLLLFKSLMAGAYLLSVVAIHRIMKLIRPEFALAGTVLFALNPLVLIESLVSAHNDIVMMTIALWAFYFLIQKRFEWAVALLIGSIAVKFATVLLVPAFCYVFWCHIKKKPISWERVGLILLVGMTVAIVAATVRTQFQPWYLLYIIPFTPLLSHKKPIVISVVIMSIAGLLQYVPFLYTGNWDPPIPTILNGVLLGGIVLAILASVSTHFFTKRYKS